MTYPPSNCESQRLFSELKRLDMMPGDEYNARKYEIIHDLAEAHFYEAKSYFISGLENPDPDYRWACISALVTHWQSRDAHVISALLNMAENDPDVGVRDIAISSLGTLKLQEALPLLKRIVEHDKEPLGIRKTAYLSILEILGHSPQEIQALWAKTDFDPASIGQDILRTI